VTPPSAGFRPEIQALRALAVLLVVVYHLYPNRLTGGYIGVDVFFVISGFLITSHLFSEVGRTGRVALGRFWARRIRRLLPAATLVLVSSFVAMLMFVPHALWQRTVTEIGASVLYVQNWVLAASSVDYLGADDSPTLVQHLWSLSIEEQFYVVWPLLITLALFVLPIRSSRVKMGLALGLVFVCSLVFSVLETARSQPSAYFHTGTRAWEFAAGGLLALAPAAWTAVDTTRWRRQTSAAASWVGVALILVAGLLYTSATPFPGAYALLPVVGTLLVIAARFDGARWSANRLTVLRPFQVVGDLSYAIYLWHWPLIVVVPYALGHPLTTLDKVAILAASLLLAALSKHLVEDPVRRAPILSAKTLRSYALAATTVLVILVASTATYVTVLQTSRATAAAVADAEDSDSCFGARAMADGSACSKPFAVPEKFDAAFWAADKGTLGTCNSQGIAVTMCAFGDTTSPSHTVALVGNSHAGHLVAGLEAYGREHGWKIVLMRKTGCMGALPTSTESTWKPCVDWSRNVDQAIMSKANGIDTVVYATNNGATEYVARTSLTAREKDEVVTAIADNLGELVAAGKTVMAFGDVPGVRPEVAPECIEEHRSEYDPCATPRSVGEEKDDFVAQAARKTPGVGYFDMLPYLCDAEKCHAMIGGATVYIDDHHLTASFSRSLGPYMGAAIDRQLASS